MDLSKAFDTLDHSILINKLKYYGIQGCALDLIKNYLSNRQQGVEINNIKSSFINLSTGVPQGSILVPFLLIIYINYFPKASNIFKSVIYADDATLIANLSDFKHHNYHTFNNNMINIELQKFSHWLMSNKLTLNLQKSKYVCASKPKLTINNTNIENTLLTIYNSLILPHLNYCILAWGYDSKRIYKLEKKAIRIISKNMFYSHSDPIFKKLEIMKIDDIHYLQQIKLY